MNINKYSFEYVLCLIFKNQTQTWQMTTIFVKAGSGMIIIFVFCVEGICT